MCDHAFHTHCTACLAALNSLLLGVGGGAGGVTVAEMAMLLLHFIKVVVLLGCSAEPYLSFGLGLSLALVLLVGGGRQW